MPDWLNLTSSERAVEPGEASVRQETVDETVHMLEQRFGPVHARQRLGIEREYESRIHGEDRKRFHLENWYAAPAVIRTCLKLTGLYGRAMRNALQVPLVENRIRLPSLPAAFNGIRILHISDPHVDACAGIVDAIVRTIEKTSYDLCVFTGDYRASTHGDISGAVTGMQKLCEPITTDTYAVLGNHDSIRMVPALEKMNIRLLLNEQVRVCRGDDELYLAGIDDAHFYRVDNIEKAASDIPREAFSILLSHTPEVYRQGAHAGFDLFLCGHTHGGQICLPGGIPVLLDARIPRRLGHGNWKHHGMSGYTSKGAGTSIEPVRLNCPGEVTVHELISMDAG